MEYKNVTKKIKTLWIIRRSIAVASVLLGLVLLLGLFFGTQGSEDPMPKEVFIVFLVIWSIGFITLFIYAYILPIFQYRVYKYKVGDDELWLNKGVIFRNEYVIPFCQIQDFNLSQGPFEILLKTKSLTVFTAGSGVTIQGLTYEEATDLENVLKENVKASVKKRLCEQQIEKGE